MLEIDKNVRTWVEVSKDALKNNYQQFRKLIKKECKLMAICKSNAYGHGLTDYTKTMQELGADWIGVDSIVEAQRLRLEGISLPILVLGYTLPEKFIDAARQNISITISSLDSLRELVKLLPKLKEGKLNIHLKIDTGMHRQGFQLNEVEKVARFVKENLPNVEIEGIYTHFAAAKNPAFPAFTQSQIDKFEKAILVVEKFGFKPIRHAAATSGTIVFPSSHYDMVRIGIGMMGLWPSTEVKAGFEEKIKLAPALSWRSIISEVKSISKDEPISYDCTDRLDQDGKIAIVPIGYWHGYRRDLSAIGHVLVKGQRARILGRITMDMIIVDISKIKDIAIGDTVTLIGQDGTEEISAYELASLSETSWYETITQINPLIKKIYR